MNEESTPREGAEQIETLEARIRELEAKLAAAGVAGNSEKQMNAAIEERAERLFEELKAYHEKYRSGGDELLRRVAEKVRENPGPSLAIALSAGLVAAKLCEHGKD